MKKIDNISNEANQLHHVTLDNGKVIDITLRYLPTIQRWVFDIASEKLTIRNKILCVLPNVLHQFKNTAGFGLACTSNDEIDPVLINDFLDDRCQLYVLEESELPDIDEIIRNFEE